MYSFHADKGIRDENQDSLLIMDEVLLFAVADGMGGGCYGSMTSQMTIRALEDELKEDKMDSLEYGYYLIQSKIQQINKYIYNLSCKNGCTMGTTLSLVMFKDDGVLIGNVGDTWICRIRNSEFKILSKVHSVAGEQYERGLISFKEYREHEMKHILTQAIGTSDEIDPYLAVEKVRKGDIYIICSDGVYNYIDEKKLVDIAIESGDNLKEACMEIVKSSIENASDDNMSIVIIKIV